MAKKSLSDLLAPKPAETVDASVAEPVREEVAPQAVEASRTEAGESRDPVHGEEAPAPRRPTRRRVATAAPVGPKYLRLERKEARIRADQYAELTQLSRALNRARAGAGERITENTLMRIGIDLVLARADELTGVDEDALRRSLGL